MGQLIVQHLHVLHSGFFPESPGGFPKGEMSPQVLETQILKTQRNGQKVTILAPLLQDAMRHQHILSCFPCLKNPKGATQRSAPASKETTSLLGTCGKVLRLRDITCIFVRTIWDHEGVPKHNFQTISASPRGTSRSSENTRSSRPGW